MLGLGTPLLRLPVPTHHHTISWLHVPWQLLLCSVIYSTSNLVVLYGRQFAILSLFNPCFDVLINDYDINKTALNRAFHIPIVFTVLGGK